MFQSSAAKEFPKYQTIGASGLDLAASPDLDKNGIEIKPGEWDLIPTGIVQLNFQRVLRHKLGHASHLKMGNYIKFTGTIDSDEVRLKIMLNKPRSENIHSKTGDRIAQMVITRIEREFKEK